MPENLLFCNKEGRIFEIPSRIRKILDRSRESGLRMYIYRLLHLQNERKEPALYIERAEGTEAAEISQKQQLISDSYIGRRGIERVVEARREVLEDTISDNFVSEGMNADDLVELESYLGVNTSRLPDYYSAFGRKNEERLKAVFFYLAD